jgi:hypothetical protein
MFKSTIPLVMSILGWWPKVDNSIALPALTTLLHHSAMQRLADYLECARQFARLAAEETNPQIKAQFEEQAAAYEKLAQRRAAFLQPVLPKRISRLP